ncbi:transposase [bacterium]|nr:transposase [bacterium]
MSGKQLDPLQKEALIMEYREKGGLMHEFCESHGVEVSSFKRWIKQYESKGIAGLLQKLRNMQGFILRLISERMSWIILSKKGISLKICHLKSRAI